MISTTEIEIAVAKYFGFLTKIIVPNVCTVLNAHECDLLVVYPSGWAIEVEIKRSKSDVKADLKKYHTHISNKIRALYFALPVEIYKECIDYIPEKAGILIVKDNGIVECVRKPKVSQFAMKLTEKEMKKNMRLGCLRIWSLKNKQFKKECAEIDKELTSVIANPEVTVL